jgi:hypothetical protein
VVDLNGNINNINNMKQKTQIQISEYLQVKHYKGLSNITSLDETEQMISIISTITEQSPSDIMKWDLPSVIKVYNVIQDIFKNINPEFYPVIEWEGQLWGYSNISKMTLGEYVDLESLCKLPEKNINQILATLYRPIISNDIPSATYVIKSTLKSLKYDVENIFDYYQLEEYDPTARKKRADKFDNFPIEIALGALAFFLDIKTLLLSDSQIYSKYPIMKEIMGEMNKMSKKKQRLLNTMAGFIHSRNWATLRSYPLQEIKPSLN